MSNRVEEIYNNDSTPEGFADGYFNYLTEVLAKIDRKQVAEFIRALETARENGSTIYFMGNGGSAATASHFANDIAIGTRSWEKPFRVIALTDNMPIVTAIGNDYSYDDIFTLQLKTLLKPNDVVVAISASGNSANVVKAIEFANQENAITIGLTGFDGGRLKEVSKLNVHAPSNKGEYGPVEDVHMIFDHLVGNYLLHKVRVENMSSAESKLAKTAS